MAQRLNRPAPSRPPMSRLSPRCGGSWRSFYRRMSPICRASREAQSATSTTTRRSGSSRASRDRIRRARAMRIDQAGFMVFDTVLAFDHVKHRILAISNARVREGESLRSLCRLCGGED